MSKTNITSIAELILRLGSLSWFFGAIILLVDLVLDLYTLKHTGFSTQYVHIRSELAIVSYSARIIVHIALGSVLLIYAQPLAGVFVRGLESAAEPPDEESPEMEDL